MTATNDVAGAVEERRRIELALLADPTGPDPTAPETAVTDPVVGDGPRPQALLFTFLGRHVLGRPDGMASSLLIDVLDQLGVSRQAARSTITRMVNRGYLERHRVGRRAYFTVSPALRGILLEGEQRIFRPLPDPGRVETWTLLSFSIPESERAARHSLRTTLAYRGFGLLRSGLWIAPGEVDMLPVLDRMDLRDRVEVFHARPADPAYLLATAPELWDLPAIAAGYRRFVAAWHDREPLPGRRLAASVQLISDWQQTVADDPVLPARYLPEDWPATQGHELFVDRLERWGQGAVEEFDALLDEHGTESPVSSPQPAAGVAPGTPGNSSRP